MRLSVIAKNVRKMYTKSTFRVYNDPGLMMEVLETTRKDPEVEIVHVGNDSYERRQARQRDLSIIHDPDPAVAFNSGWKRELRDGAWTGMMIRRQGWKYELKRIMFNNRGSIGARLNLK